MPKKAPKNSYFYFMLEHKKKMEQMGKHFPGGMQQVAEECSDLWKALPKEKRAIYEEIAKNNKKGNPGEKYSSQGVAISMIEKNKKTEQENDEFLKNKIIEIIDLATNINCTNFYFITFNYFCKTTAGYYYPAEIGLIKYNLEEGVTDSYNTIIKLESLPLGMAYSAKSLADETHKIILPPKTVGEGSFINIFENIYDFILDRTTNTLHPLITSTENIPMVENILNLFCNEADSPENTFTILSLTNVFFALKRQTAKIGLDADGFSTTHLAQVYIDRDTYEYYAEKSCEYHEKMETTKFCTMSIVKRWAFTISDHCCLDLGIKLIPGKHLPKDAETTVPNINFKYEDEKSLANISDSDVSELASNVSYITQPRKIRRNNQSLTADMFNLTLGTNETLNDTLNSTANPWRRSNAPTRPPSDDLINFPSLGGGKGRGLLLTKK